MVTDHEALKYALNMKDPHGRIARCMSLFAEFEFEIQYRPGAKNGNANFLSRSVEQDSVLVTSMGLEEDLNAIAEYLSSGKLVGDNPSFRRAVNLKANSYPVHEGSSHV